MTVRMFVACASIVMLGRQSTAQEVNLDDNAALWYWRAIAEAELVTQATEEFLEELESYDRDINKPVSASMRETVASLSVGLQDLRTGSSLERCVFAFDKDAGPGTLLPHLPKMRTATRYLCLHARISLEDGDTVALTKDLIAGYKIAEHLSNDEIAISSMAAKQLFDWFDALAERALKERILKHDQLTSLREAIAATFVHDPLSFAQALVGERTLWNRWFVKLGTGPNARRTFIDLCGGPEDSTLDMSEEALDWVITSEEFQEGIRRFDNILLHAHQAFQLSVTEKARASVQKIVQANLEHAEDFTPHDPNMVPAILLIDLVKLFDAMLSVRSNVKSRIDSLDGALRDRSTSPDPPP